MRRHLPVLVALLVVGCEPQPPAVPATTLAPAIKQSAAQPLRRGVFAPPRHAGPALGLTASDGTGLTLTALAARSVVSDPLAFTELRMVFENPEDRTLEGTFRITLPQGAAISRFSMRIDDRWQEGEVVEKQAARQAYEDFLHRKQDPALLEQAAGNEFSARVFPIPARGRKELVLSYSEEMPRSGEPFRLPLGGLPKVGSIEAEVYGGREGALLGAFRQERAQPEGDFVVELQADDRGPGLRSGDLLVARVTAVAEAQPEPMTSALLLVDTSASRALGFEAELTQLTALARRAGEGGAKIAVMAFDQTQEVVYEGDASGFGSEALDRLRTRGALGASDLGAALAAAGEKARALGLRRVVLLGDGVSTAGVEGEALKARAAALKEAGVERLDAVAIGGIRDDDALRRLSTVGLARDGVVAEASEGDGLWRRLTSRTRSKIPVSVAGARWWYPRTLDGMQAGDEALVYAELPASEAVKISLGERTVAPALAQAERPLLERSWARAKIDALMAQGGAEARAQVIELSTRHRVVSPLTALLVLETDADYARFKLDRNALVDILTVQQGKISVAGRSLRPLELATSPPPAPPPDDRDTDDDEARKEPPKREAPRGQADRPATAAPPAPAADRPADRIALAAPAASGPVAGAPPPPPPPPSTEADKAKADTKEEAFGAGGLGLSGIAEGGGGAGEGIGLGSAGTIGHGAGTATGQGFGSGHGRLGGNHRSPAPQVRMGATTVNGRLPPEVIQRIVRQNFGRFRLCYENGLRRNPNLSGGVTVRFVIGTDGNVKSTQGSGTMPDASVISCVTRGFQGLSFPQPEGGIVTVTYPISFSPAGSTPGQPARPQPEEPERPAAATPYSGRFQKVMSGLSSDPKAALSEAAAWHKQQPGDLLALVALGEAHEKLGATETAARAYGSIIDLFPARADLRRFAAARLERLGQRALDAAIDTLTRAREQRPDHPSSHRMLGMALLRKGEHEQAFKVIAEGLGRKYPPDRFAGYERILREDLGLIAAAWIKASPAKKGQIEAMVKEAGGALESGPSLRFVLNWETDANDVDFHIYDSKGGHAYYSRPKLKDGGELYADVTTGYGPECFTIRKPAAQRPEYTLQAHYYSRGPMGYGMGKLEIIDHDGKGNLSFEERPFVVMQDHAYIDLGKVASRR